MHHQSRPLACFTVLFCPNCVAIIGAALISGVLAALIILPLLVTVGQVGHYVRSKLLYLDPWPVPEIPFVEELPQEVAQTL